MGYKLKTQQTEPSHKDHPAEGNTETDMHQMEATYLTLCLLLPLAVVNSSRVSNSLRTPVCNSRTLQTTITLMHGHLAHGAAHRDIDTDMSCSNSIFGCDPNLSSQLRSKCHSGRVDTKLINSKSLCKWAHEIKWSKVRLPHSMVQARLSDSSACMAASGQCRPITKATSVMEIRNSHSAGRPCRYSYRQEDITVGFRCVKWVS